MHNIRGQSFAEFERYIDITYSLHARGKFGVFLETNMKTKHRQFPDLIKLVP